MAADFAEQRAWGNAQELIHEAFHLAGYSGGGVTRAAGEWILEQYTSSYAKQNEKFVVDEASAIQRKYCTSKLGFERGPFSHFAVS